MNITQIHSYLVNAEKGDDTQSPIKGTAVGSAGDMYDILKKIFDDAPQECQHDIAFQPAEDGTQQNDCRDLILQYIESSTLPNGRHLAARLQQITTKRSGLGLLFLILGVSNNRKRLVISRFPADNGILAEEGSSSLNVKFVERIFMKSAKAYKSVMFEGVSMTNDFWLGKAVDRQINNEITISEYWIKEFLLSDFSTTAERGTRTLASALRDAINDNATSLNVKDEISSAVRLCRTLNNQSISAISFCQRMNLSQDAKDAILNKIKLELQSQRFRLSVEELDRLIAFKTIELDSGAYLSALASNFDDVFTKTSVAEGNIRYSATGKVTDERIRKRK